MHGNDNIEFYDQCQQGWKHESESHKDVGDFYSLFLVLLAKCTVRLGRVLNIHEENCFEWHAVFHRDTSKMFAPD